MTFCSMGRVFPSPGSFKTHALLSHSTTQNAKRRLASKIVLALISALVVGR